MTDAPHKEMPQAIKAYVHWVDKVNYWVGLVAMYMVFLMLAILFYSVITKNMHLLHEPLALIGITPGEEFFNPPLWTLEMAQFTMVAYYLLGGGRALQLDAHVRMDLVYSRWSPRTQATVDAFTILFLIFFLVMLLYGGISSTHYALEYGETSYSSWSPYMAPIKIIMVFAVFMTLLQAIANFFRDVAKARGAPMS
jgi:TRAP-type mannitol/chloroaromatic compound transport system permease small subunit